MGLAEAATESLVVSEEIGTVKKLFDLGMQLKTVPSNRITMTTMPTVADPENANHLLPAGDDAERMWAMLRDDVPFDDNGGKDGGNGGNTAGGNAKASAKPSGASASDAADIDVLVRNATRSTALGPVDGRARAVARTLVEQGFDRATADTSAALSGQRPVVRHPDDESAEDARRVAEALGIPASATRKSTDVSGVTVDIGADWRSGTLYPQRKKSAAGDLPAGSDALNGSETGTCMDVYKPYRW
jgi:hypothetical protein